MSDITNKDLPNILKDGYLRYSMAVIKERALPDVRDGLKPVHRRILYAAHELGLTSRTAYKKSARVVGDTMGKYHPHGDSSIYSAMVRMAQPFSMNTPLIDGQGNFGSIDGDNAAAQRYTEVRLTKAGEENLKDIDKDAVDFKPNYDDSLLEPDVLPTRIPNLLLNGSEGIAVGMTTSIPSHNLTELMDAIIHILKDNPKDNEELYSIMKGPDFGTGGILFGTDNIRKYYETGRSTIKIGSKWHEEVVDGRKSIVIDEIPYQIDKSKLVIQIDTLAKNSTIDGMYSISDESNDKGIRIVIQLKQGVNPEIVVNKLYKHSNLLSTFSCILLAIVNGEPKVLTLREILDHFIVHRKTVIIRKTIFELNKVKARIHILEGLEKAISKIDETIAIIRKSTTAAESKEGIIELLDISDIQAQAILDMKLQRLSSFELDKIINTLNELNLEKSELEGLLKDQDKLDQYIIDESTEIRDSFKSKRRTDIVSDEISYNEEDFIANEAIYIVKSNNHYITTVKVSNIERQRRGGKGKRLMKLNKDDFISDVIEANLHDSILLITNLGRAYRLKAHKLPATEQGKALVNLLDLQEGEKIINILKTSVNDKLVVLTTKYGQVIKMGANLLNFNKFSGVQIVKFTREDDQIVSSSLLQESENQIMSLVTKEGKISRFSLDDIRQLKVRRGSGVRGMRLKDGNYITSNIIRNRDDDYNLMSITENGYIKKTKISAYSINNRGGLGMKVANLDKHTGKLVDILDENDNYDLVIITKLGKIIQVDTSKINSVGRVSKGVIGIKLDKRDSVVSSIKTFKDKDDQDDDLN